MPYERGREGGEVRPKRAINILHTNVLSKSPCIIPITPNPERKCMSSNVGSTGEKNTT
jgi:hypothetical protein